MTRLTEGPVIGVESHERNDMNFNGNETKDDTVYVPAENYMHVANTIRSLTERGVSITHLQVAVGKGRLQLGGDETGSYGIHMWDC